MELLWLLIARRCSVHLIVDRMELLLIIDKGTLSLVLAVLLLWWVVALPPMHSHSIVHLVIVGPCCAKANALIHGHIIEVFIKRLVKWHLSHLWYSLLWIVVVARVAMLLWCGEVLNHLSIPRLRSSLAIVQVLFMILHHNCITSIETLTISFGLSQFYLILCFFNAIFRDV